MSDAIAWAFALWMMDTPSWCYPFSVAPRFVRLCPRHCLILEEQPHGLRCPLSFHQVTAWLVVDLRNQRILGAGRADRIGGRAGRAGAVFLGPRLRITPELLADAGERRYARSVPAHPAAA